MGPEDAKDKQYKKFKKLPEEWRNEMMKSEVATINETIKKAAINNVVLALAKEADGDLDSLKEQLATANAVYKDGTKTNNIKIEFLVETLRSRGENIPDIEAFFKNAAQALSEQE